LQKITKKLLGMCAGELSSNYPQQLWHTGSSNR